MAQLSRPYQIALIVLGLFAAVWFAALHRPGSSSSSSSSAPAQTAPAKTPPTSAYDGSAPGVAGLTRDIAKAHGAVKQSEQNASQLQRQSAQASSPSASTPPSAAAAHRAAKTGATSTRPAAAKSKTNSFDASNAAPVRARRALHAKLSHELAQGKVLLLLFWNPRSSDDKAVRHQLEAAAARLKSKVAVHIARANQVGEYTSITREVQVYGTPTLLVVGRHGLASTFTGLLDAFAIEQAVSEAKHAGAKS